MRVRITLNLFTRISFVYIQCRYEETHGLRYGKEGETVTYGKATAMERPPGCMHTQLIVELVRQMNNKELGYFIDAGDVISEDVIPAEFGSMISYQPWGVFGSQVLLVS